MYNTQAFADLVISRYLYNANSAPGNKLSEDLIRDLDAKSAPIQVNVAEYMDTVGRFALLSQFSLVRTFMYLPSLQPKYDAAGNLTFYTKAEVAEHFGLQQLFISVQQYRVDDGSGDLGVRTLIWNSTAFSINDDAEFWVYEDGRRIIDNVTVLPYQMVADGAENENYDLESNDLQTLIANNLLVRMQDPSQIGREVEFQFTGSRATIDGYGWDQFTGELNIAASWSRPLIPLYSAIENVTAAQFDSGITRFLEAGTDRPIIYGTQENDFFGETKITSATLTSLSYLYDYLSNGYVLIGGAGDDALEGGANNDKVLGGADDDRLFGGRGDDELDGGEGRDQLNGNEGDDILLADADDTQIDGGEGTDKVDYSNSEVAIDWESAGTIVSGVEEVIGSRFDDKLNLPSTPILGSVFDSNVKMDGGQGDDEIGGNDAVNTLRGGEGDDTIQGKAGNDDIEGGAGDDTITAGDESYLFASDDDTVRGNAGDDQIKGGEGDDRLWGDEGNDRLDGGDGEDFMLGGTGNDIIDGGDEDDRINGESGDDRIQGGDGADTILGGEGNDVIVGGSGVDDLNGGGGNDVLDATTDDNFFGAYADRLTGGGGGDRFLTNNGDVILDIDGGDRVQLDGSWLNGGEKDAPPPNPCASTGDSEESEDGTYEAADGTTYQLSGSTLTVTSAGLFGSTITIENFRNGDGGIRLKPTRPDTDQAECNRDPLIIDLDGDRNVVRELYDSNAYFDLDNDGFREHVAWTLAGDGLLVHDRNGNGSIDDGSELFGSGHTEFGDSINPPPRLGAAGFAQLANYDSNGDGRISAADSDFAALRVWIDANGDGVTDGGELKTLAELGLVSISLRTRVSDDSDCGCDGTEVTHMSTVTRSDGTATGIYDAYLSIDQYDTREIVDIEVPADFASLPFLIGSGTLSDLDVAMARDPALEALVRRFAGLTLAEAGEINALVEEIVLRWTGADAVAADSRGQSVNARWLTALEKVSGSAFSQFGIGSSPRDDASAILNSEWKDLVGRVTAQLLGQTALGQELTPGLSFAAAAFYVVAEGTTLASLLDTAVANAPDSRADALTYWEAIVSILLPYRADLGVSETQLYASIEARLPDGALPIGIGDLAAASTAGAASGIAVGTTAFRLGQRVFEGEDILIALPGARELVGAGGNDTYLVARDVDVVTITETGGAKDLLLLYDWRQDRTTFSASVDVYDPGAEPSEIDVRITVRIASLDTSAQVELGVSLVGGRLQGIEKLAFDDDVRRDFYDLLPPVVEFPDGSGALYIGASIAGTALNGGGGDDLLLGRSVSDSYRLAPGSGRDVIIEAPDSASTGDALVIHALPGEATFEVTGDSLQDLTVTLADGGERVTISEQWSGTGRQIESFRFADGSTLTAAEVRLRLTTGTPGDEDIVGTYGDDIMDGRGGGDRLTGGRGNDVYAFLPGYGALEIHDLDGQSVIDIGGGATFDDLSLRSSRDGLSIGFAGSGDSIRLTGNPDGNSIMIRIGGVERSANSILFDQALRAGTSVDGYVYGTMGDDHVQGTDAAEVIDGLGGQDSLSGGLGNDTYLAGNGITRIFDTGFGFDTLLIGAEFTLEDLIFTTAGSPYSPMRIRIGGTDIRIDTNNGFSYNSGQVDGNGGDDIERILFADGRSIDIGSGKRVVGTAGDDVLFSYSNGTDTFNPGAGNDRIFALNGRHNVELTADYGHDVFYPSYQGFVRFQGVAFDDQVSLKRIGLDLLVETGGGSDSILIKNAFEPLSATAFSSLIFTDHVLSFADVAEHLSVSTPGDDLLFGRADLDGGAGNDVLIGTSIANHYVFARGYGHDVIKEQESIFGDAPGDTLTLTGLNRADVAFSRHPTDPLSIVITILETGETLTLDGTPFDDFVYSSEDSLGDGYSKGDVSGGHWINTIFFADGSTMSQRDVEQVILDSERTDGADTLTNFGAASSSFGGQGGAVLDGGRGDDALFNPFRDVAVRLSPNSGHDVLHNAADRTQVHVQLSGIDVGDVLVRFVERDGVPFTLVQTKDGSELAIEGQRSTDTQLYIIAEDGTYYYPSEEGGLVPGQTGTDGIDYLVGEQEFTGGEVGFMVPSDDVFDGGEGDDVIAGRGGSDTILFDRGDGADILLRTDLSEGPFGGWEGFAASVSSRPGYHIVLGPEIARDSLTISWLTDGSESVVFSFGEGDSITVDAGSVASLEFAAGEIIEFVAGGGGTIELYPGYFDSGTDADDVFLAVNGDVSVRFEPGRGSDRLIDSFLRDYQPGQLPPNGWRPSTLYIAGGEDLAGFEFVRYLDQPNHLVVRNLATGDSFTVADQFAATGGLPSWYSVDADGDGAADWGSIDSDSDGRPDFLAMDSDGDGAPDWATPDFNGDGQSDWQAFVERSLDVDGDGEADVYAYDDDGDGLVDHYYLSGAAYPAGDIAFRDTDGDRIPDEYSIDQDVWTAVPVTAIGEKDWAAIDTDADGIGDAAALDGNGDGVPDWVSPDLDGDGLSDWRSQTTEYLFNSDGQYVASRKVSAAGEAHYMFGVYVFGQGSLVARDIDGDQVPDEYGFDRDGDFIADAPALVAVSQFGIEVETPDGSSTFFYDWSEISGLVVERPQAPPTGGTDTIDLFDLRPRATAGDDVLILLSGESVNGLGGDDLLLASEGSGIVRFGPGGGHDRLVGAPDSPDAQNLRVELIGITSPGQVEFLRGAGDSDDLVIRIVATGETLTVVNQFRVDGLGYARPVVTSFALGDGQMLSWQTVAGLAIGTHAGGDGEISTGSGGGTLDGGAGNDVLRGGTGDDLYRLGRGYDEDVVRDSGGRDTILFGAGIGAENLFFSRAGTAGGDLLIEVTGVDRLAMTVVGQFADPAARVETLLFEDGSRLNWRDVEYFILDSASTGGDDVIQGFRSDDRISAKGGNDSLTGGEGNDVLDGGAGRDVAIFRGSLGDYEVVTVDGVTTVRDLVANRDGTDILRGIEDLRFLGGGGASLDLVPSNRVPTAGSLERSTSEDVELVVTRADLMAATADADGDALALSLTASAVGGRAWIDRDGNVRFRPDENFSGPAHFDYRVEDGNGGVATGRINVSVTAENDAPTPTAPIGTLSGGEDRAVRFDLPASLFGDADGDSLTLTVETAAGGAVPEWLSYSGGQLVGQPPADYHGALALRLVANDGLATSSISFELVIDAVNDAPRLVSGLPNLLVAPESTVSVGLAGRFTDVDGDPLQLFVKLAGGAALPSWLTFDGATLSGTAPADFTGSLSIAVAASDGAASTLASFVIAAPINRAPVATLPVSVVASGEDSSLAITLPAKSFVDPDGDPLTIGAAMADGSALPSWLTFDGTRFTGLPPANFHGILKLTLTASDGTLTATAPLDLAIVPVNDAPVVTAPIEDRDVVAGTNLSVLVREIFADVDGDPLQVTLSLAGGGALPSWLVFDGSTLSGAVPAGFSGRLELLATASDGLAAVSEAFALVGGQNRGPQVTRPLATLRSAEDGAISLVLPSDSFVDPDGDPLVLSATLADGSPLPSWLAFDGIRFTGLPPANFHGSLMLKVTASDGSLGIAAPLELEITPVNDAPVVANPLADQHARAGTASGFAVPAASFADVDLDPLTYSATLANGAQLPSWLSFNAATRSFAVGSGASAGAYEVRVSASDGQFAAADVFTLTVDSAVYAGSTAGFSFNALNSWYNPAWGGGYIVTFNYTVQADAILDGSLKAWSILAGYDGNGQIVGGWLNGFNGSAPFSIGAAGGTFTNVGQGWQPILTAGTTFQLSLHVTGAAYESDDFDFTIFDRDPALNRADALDATINAGSTTSWSGGLSQHMTVRNVGGVMIDDWAVVLDAPDGVTFNFQSVWGATATQLSNGDIRFDAVSWNETLAAGGQADFGFTGNYTGGPVGPLADLFTFV